MSWRVVWPTDLRADLDIAGPELFEHAGSAVHAFAERGDGKAYPVDVDGSVWRFFVPGGQVYVRADLDADTLEVMAVVPNNALPMVTPLLDDPLDDPEDDEDE
jgi:hypothetical protein